MPTWLNSGSELKWSTHDPIGLCCSGPYWQFLHCSSQGINIMGCSALSFLLYSFFEFFFTCFGVIKKQWIHSVYVLSGWEEQVGSLEYLIWPCCTPQRQGEWALKGAPDHGLFTTQKSHKAAHSNWHALSRFWHVKVPKEWHEIYR